MTRFDRIEQLFGDASDLPPAERAAFVANAAGDDAALRDEVISLLAHAIGAAETLGRAVAGEATAFVHDRATRHFGRRIGPYMIIGLLGEGGMGAVYAAERADAEFDQRVAIKILPFGLDLPDAIARFRDERQILASLDHPNIVRLLDGGRTDDDLPYLVMEHIDGQPITAHASERSLPVAARVRLFRDVCAAVHHAHEKLVIHRDLKPSNILVDASGTAKLLDFGIAKLVDPLATRESRTHTGTTPLTPRYASPEQVGRAPVSFSTDIYSLGVVLRELLPPEIDSDLDMIMTKAMRDEPEQRYASAEDLADDLGRFLAGLPVCARRPTVRYRAAKFVARHRVMLAATAAVVAVGSAGAWALRTGSDGPARDRRVAVIARNRGAAEDDWLAPAVAHIAAQRLRDRDLRFTVVDDAASASVTARLEFRRTQVGVSLEASIGPRRFEPIEATTMSDALDKLVPLAADLVGDGQPERGPDARERTAMARLGTTSFAAFRAYEQVSADALRTLVVDDEALARRAAAVVALDPAWPHAYLLQYWTAPSNQASADVMTHARAMLVDRTRDPDALALLDAAERATAATQLDPRPSMEAIAIAAPIVDRDPDDLMAAWTLASAYVVARLRGDDQISLASRLYVRYPELRFGSDLANLYLLTGRVNDADRVLRTWLRATPQSEQALAAQLPAAVDASNADSAVRTARDLVFLHGDGHRNLLVLCDALIAADRPREAATIADRLLAGSDRDRASARARIGIIAISEGRFASALETLASVGETDIHNLELAHELAQDLGATADRDRIQLRLAALTADTPDPIAAGMARFEAALEHGCPSIDAALAQLPINAPIREDGRRWLARTAAARGCVPCGEVVHMGLSTTEFDPHSLLNFVGCAEREGKLELAQDALAKLLLVRDHPYVAILARYRLGRVLERLGKPAQARTEYARFLAHWGHADRSLADVEDARVALARLHE